MFQVPKSPQYFEGMAEGKALKEADEKAQAEARALGTYRDYF